MTRIGLRIATCMLAFAGAAGHSQTIRYVTLPKMLIEQRLNTVVCVMPGEIDSVILIGGHFDFVDRGRGVVDNWSGASMLPSLFQSLASVPRRHTFVFIGFTDDGQP